VLAFFLGRLYLDFRAEQPLVAAIRQQGGTPVLAPLANPADERLFKKVFSPSLPLHECGWLTRAFAGLSRRVIGVEYTNTHLTSKDLEVLAKMRWLTTITFAGSRLDDDSLVSLGKAPRLDGVDFSNMPVSRGTLASIGRMQRLLFLSFRDVDLDPADLVSLRQLSALHSLSIFHSRTFNDIAFEHIGQIRTLYMLRCSEVDITDEGLRHLSGLTKLAWLDIESSEITGSGLIYLKALPVLRDLSLARCAVTDDALACLKDFPNLTGVDLQGETITDAAAPHLAAIPGLARVSVVNTRMSVECRRWLRNVRKDATFYDSDGDAMFWVDAASQPAATLPSSAE
jgi:hypothetical protein